MHFDNEINGNISIEKIEEDQKKVKSELNEVITGNPKQKSKDKVIKLYSDYAKIISGAKSKPKQGTGLKILTPKWMLQRLRIALAQVKAGNNSENLLNEIKQVAYSL